MPSICVTASASNLSSFVLIGGRRDDADVVVTHEREDVVVDDRATRDDELSQMQHREEGEYDSGDGKQAEHAQHNRSYYRASSPNQSLFEK